MRLYAICAAALLASSARAGVPAPAPVPSTSTYEVTLQDELYHFQIPIDPAHDPADCGAGRRLSSNQARSNYEFTFYQCSGAAFRVRVSGPDGLAAEAAHAGKFWDIYPHRRPVLLADGTPIGYVFATCVPVPLSRCIYGGDSAHPLTKE